MVRGLKVAFNDGLDSSDTSGLIQHYQHMEGFSYFL